METTTALYVRISRDTEGHGLGVARQESACRELATQRGWEPVRVYEDNDVSAYSGKRRPAYTRLLDDMRGGRVRRVVTWRLDRLHRDVPELLGFMDLARLTGCEVVAVLGGALDVATASASSAPLCTARSRNSSPRRSPSGCAPSCSRTPRPGSTTAVPARTGGRRTGGRRTRTRRHVRLAARLMLGGNSMKAVARALNEAGSRNTMGTEWSDVTVRAMVLRARNAGLRTHHGAVLDGVIGTWEAILDRDTWDRVRVLLTDPARRTTPGAGGRTHLLSGIARCGICGGPLRATKGKPYKGMSATIYRCTPTGCVSRNQERMDDLACNLVCARLARADAVDLLAGRAAPSAPRSC